MCTQPCSSPCSIRSETGSWVIGDGLPAIGRLITRVSTLAPSGFTLCLQRRNARLTGGRNPGSVNVGRELPALVHAAPAAPAQPSSLAPLVALAVALVLVAVVAAAVVAVRR